MNWLRKIFGGRGEGPVYGQADVPLEKAKPDLLRLLAERGARSALIVYDGGNDEGWMTAFTWSEEPLPAPASAFAGDALPGGRAVDVEHAMDAVGGPDDALYAAAEAVMCDKWGSFAGEFAVRGRLVVDVDAGEIVRQDDVWLFGEQDYDELEASDEEVPSRAPDLQQVEKL